jgi:hypothetical protein
MADSIKQLEQALALRQSALAIEEKMLDAMSHYDDASKQKIGQQNKVNELKLVEEKLGNKLLKIEIALEKAGKGRAAVMKTMTLLGGTLLGSMDKLRDLSKQYSADVKATGASLGINVNEARKMNKEIMGQIKGEKMFQTTMGSVVDMQNELNDAYGGSVKFSAETAVNMDIAASKLGVSNASAASFSKLMFLSGEASGEVAMNTLASVKSLSDASGVKFSAVMKDIAASGKEMMSYFGGSATEIAIMAVKARKLGFELSDMKSTSEALLDVEGRIEKQMSLNMLTGKNINLDKATQLTLEGDMIGAQKEVLAQLGDVSQMNIMERQLASDMLGMDVMKIANASELAKQADESAAATAEILRVEAEIRAGQVEEFKQKQLDRVDALDKETALAAFAENAEKKLAAKLIADEKGNNLAMILQGIQTAIAVVSAAAAASSALKEATEKRSLGHSIKALPKLIAGGIATMAKAVAGIFAGMASLGPFGIPLAIAGIASMVGLASKAKGMIMNDGIIDPKKGMVVNGPEGSIQLNKKDSIIAGTDLAGGGKSGKDQPSLNTPNAGMKGAGGMDIGPLVKKIDELIAAVRQSRVLNVDGYQLNEVLHLEKTPSGV